MICCAIPWCVALTQPEAKYCVVHAKRPQFRRPEIATGDDPELTICVACDGTGECHECDGTGECQETCTHGHSCGHECEACEGTGDCEDCEGAFRDAHLTEGERKYLVWAQAGPIVPHLTEPIDWEPW